MVKKSKLNVDMVPAIKRLELATKQMITSRIIGGEISIFKGRGLEFSDYREYTTNDDSSRIDWKASARTNKTLIKEYVEEKNINVFFLIDSSQNMIFGSTPKLKIEYAVEVVGSIANATLEEGNCVGFALFDLEIGLRKSPCQGIKQYYAIMQELVKAENYGGAGSDLEKALKFVIEYLEEGSVLIIVSDFISWTENLEDYMRIVSSKFDVIAMIVKDPRDTKLPPNVGQVVIEDPFSSKQVVIDPNVVGNVYETFAKIQEKALEKSLVASNIDFIKLSTDKDFIKPIISLFNQRASRWR